jgi:hypothetical protein
MKRASRANFLFSEFDTLETGPDVCPPYDQRGMIAVGFAWLAFYVIVAIHHLMTFG